MLLVQQRELTRLEKQGVIQAFEYTYELGWNTFKDFLVWQGIEGIMGSRGTIREAFAKGLVDDGEGWMAMLVDRNRTSRTYNGGNRRSHPDEHPQPSLPLLTALEHVMLKRLE
ncbi:MULTISPECIES: HI0074 family nucleotidyltransferase substrate-binding subunit [unclassified Pseudomonas]|uniref:HI0074 family nucleotidyltransferase substrate-binding subunit n=1 Tax=unclassified Pseudomonas TaxID=196821 RepID=UPI0023545E56|nr:HI0074 family nucleotidyltransferase substrate-binding subunit [Pseudomonas sp.]